MAILIGQAMKKYIENNFASFKMDRGILHIAYKENLCLSLKAAKEVVSQRLKIQHGRAYPIVCDMRGIKDVTVDAKEYLVTEGSVLISALAMITKTPLSLLYTEIYTLETPPITIRRFTDESRALEFLRPFVELNDH